MNRSLQGDILTPNGFVRGRLDFSPSGRIEAIEGEPCDDEQVREDAQPIILPGFIDLHVHGGGGHDIMQGGEAAEIVTRTHAAHGTTALLATTMTAPFEDLERAFRALQVFCEQEPAGCARVLGVHLEGPYINPSKLGAQPDFARRVSLDELERLGEWVRIRVVTLAPEVQGHFQDIPQLVARGYRVQVGHSSGHYEDGVRALSCGATSFTHLFNAMTALHHREPGIVGAALAHAQYAEIIPDLMHVHPGAIRTALRAIPGLYCVTDSTAATGMPDGEYMLGRQRVTKCLGGVRLADGTLAGSALTMDRALRNLVERVGLTVTDASRRLSALPAEYLELTDRGRLAVGAWGDVVVLDRDLRLTDVFLEGVPLEHAHAA